MQKATIPHRIESFIRPLLERFSGSPYYALVTGLLALLATLSMTVPATFVLVPAVLASPARWRSLWLWACLGSATGGVLLVLFFHHLAWGQVYALFPKFETSKSWIRVEGWVEDYGLYALAWVAALPLPQTPALLLCGIGRVPAEGVFAAMLAGKLAKYGVVAWMVSRFPERFARFLSQRESG